MNLTEFLLARIAEDEEGAQTKFVARRMIGRKIVEVPIAMRPGGWALSPARVLAECEAKRRIVEMHPIYGDDLGDDAQHDCPGEWVNHVDDPNEPCPTLRLLALPYADHPSYRQEWKP